MVRWLERQGYDVTYSTSIDTHRTWPANKTIKGFLSHFKEPIGKTRNPDMTRGICLKGRSSFPLSLSAFPPGFMESLDLRISDVNWGHEPNPISRSSGGNEVHPDVGCYLRVGFMASFHLHVMCTRCSLPGTFNSTFNFQPATVNREP